MSKTKKNRIGQSARQDWQKIHRKSWNKSSGHKKIRGIQ